MVNGVPVSITQLSIQTLAGQEGPDSVAPVVITALAPSLDRSLKTSDLRQNKEVVLVSFQKGFDKDICLYLLLDQADCDPML